MFWVFATLIVLFIGVVAYSYWKEPVPPQAFVQRSKRLSSNLDA